MHDEGWLSRGAWAAARSLYEQCEQIDAEAAFQGQVEQDIEAEQFDWMKRVANIILRELTAVEVADIHEQSEEIRTMDPDSRNWNMQSQEDIAREFDRLRARRWVVCSFGPIPHPSPHPGVRT